MNNTIELDIAIIAMLISLASPIINIIFNLKMQKKFEKSNTQVDVEKMKELQMEQSYQKTHMAVVESSVKSHGTKLTQHDKDISNLSSQHDKDMSVIRDRLNELGSLKIEASFAQLQTELIHIKQLLKDITKGRGL